MSDRLRVGLLFGGRSVEHEISLVSARGVDAALSRERFEVVPIAVTPEGAWLSPERSEPILRSGAVRVEEGPESGDGRIFADPGRGGLRVLAADGTLRPLPLDAIFSVVHGWGGEDGRIQGLLELAGIPCVGAGVLGSAAAMDKAVGKTLAAARGVPVGPWRLVTEEAYRAGPAEILRGITATLPFPLFVKPANGGSSVGIAKVRAAEALPAAIDAAFRHDARVIVEAGVDAREIECAVLGGEAPEASVPGEIVPSNEFYDYAAKYVDGASGLEVPASLEPAVASEVRRLSIEVFRALDLHGMARVDFFLERESGRLLFNEANTLPGFTPISMYPRLWEATGVPYPRLVERLVALAIERERREAGRVRTFGG